VAHTGLNKGWHTLAVTAAAVLLGGVLTAPAAAQTPSTTRVSLSSSGTQANQATQDVTVSANGRFAAFASEATTLVAGDTNGLADIFIRDRLTGETRRVNVGPGGVQAAGGSSDLPEISADGRYVVFRSSATNLVADGGSFRIYLHDRVTGLVSRVAAPAGTVATPVSLGISADGSRVVYSTFVGGQDHVFVAETATGSVRRVTQTADGTAANGTSFDADISGDGRWVAFTTASTNLATPDANGYRDVVAHDLVTGTFTRVSVGAGGAEANLHSSTPALSHDGCIAAFFSSATNLVAGDLGVQPKVFARDRCAGETEIVSLSNGGAQGVAKVPIDISADGCRVVFLATTILAPAPVAGDGAALRDRCAGTTSRLDLATTGDPGNFTTTEVSISGGTGRYVGLTSWSSNLVPGDTNTVADAFIRDLATNTPPIAELTTTVVGRRVTVDATASRDPDGAAVAGSISFGDGSPEQPGLSAVHDYARGGTFSVAVKVTDADGVSATKAVAVDVPEPVAPAPPPPPDGTVIVVPPPVGTPPPPRLVLDRVGLSRTRFAVVPRGAKAGGARGAQLTVRLSAAARLTLRFERARSGRRSRGRCVIGARRGSRCTRWTTPRTLTRSLKAGTSTLLITGRVGTRTLPVGRHRVRVSARTSDGRTAGPRTLTFTIVAAKRARR
jgi:hypothetical protein